MKCIDKIDRYIYPCKGYRDLFLISCFPSARVCAKRCARSVKTGRQGRTARTGVLMDAGLLGVPIPGRDIGGLRTGEAVGQTCQPDFGGTPAQLSSLPHRVFSRFRAVTFSIHEDRSRRDDCSMGAVAERAAKSLSKCIRPDEGCVRKASFLPYRGEVSHFSEFRPVRQRA